MKNAIMAAAIATTVSAAPAPPGRIPRASLPTTNDVIPVRSLGEVSVNKPGFATVMNMGGSNSLLLSQFQAFGDDSVSRIDDLAGLVKSGDFSDAKVSKVSGSVTWPNDVTAAPSDVFGTDGFVVAGGFLVPGKGNGGIWFSPTSSTGQSGKLVKLGGQSGWFYHRVIFADMDMDGQQEMVSCRAKKPLFGGTSTMLVYFKPSDPSNPTGTWTETEIGPGCDALFTLADLDGDGVPEIIAASYFTSQLNLFTSSNKSKGFADKSSVKTTLLDRSIGAAFDVQVVDINNDGKKDLLVTNHQGGGSNPSGSVYAYEVPSDITVAANYKRHVIAQNFPVTQGGLNQAAPGTATAFFPTKASQAGFPYIALAGDAAQIAYVLVPGARAFEYQVTELVNCGCTVGGLAVADVDGDGSVEIFVPCYDNGVVAAFSFGA